MATVVLGAEQIQRKEKQSLLTQNLQTCSKINVTHRYRKEKLVKQYNSFGQRAKK